MAAVGNLVANFLATTGGFTKPVAAMQRQTASFAASVKGSIGDILGAFKPIASIVAPFAGAFALKHVVDEARTAAASAKKFQAVLDATGGAAGITTEQMQEFAGELQKTTNFEDDATVAAAALLATFTNIRGDVFKSAIVSAMDFAAVTGTDLPAAISLIGKALNDPINGMMKLRKAGIQLTDEQKQQVAQFQAAGNMAAAQNVILEAMQGRFGGAAKAMASPFTQVQNIIGDISENIGFALLPVLKEVVGVVTEWAGPLQNANELFKQFGEDVAFTFRNFTSLFEIAGIDMELAIIDAIPGMKGGFEEIGATILGVWEGGKAGFSAFLDNVLGGFEEIKNVFSAVIAGIGAAWDSVISGDVTAAGSAFADAFISTLAGQEGAAPAKNPFQEAVDAFNKARNDAKEGFAEPGGGIDSGLKARREKLLEDIGRAEEERRKRQEHKNTGKLPGELPGGKTPEIKGVEAATFGSKEALSSIFAAMRTKGETLQEKLLDAAEATAENSEEMAGYLEDMASNPQIEFVAGVV
jgi:hypothetical protein